MHDYSQWETQNGEVLRLSEMNEVHIDNCINMLRRQVDAIIVESNALRQAPMPVRLFEAMVHKKNYIKSFQKELKKRLDTASATCYNGYSEGNIKQKSKGENYMTNSTGIVRRIDDLGRIVIPKELRRKLKIREGEPLEVYVQKNGDLGLRKHGNFKIDTANEILRNAKPGVTFMVNRPFVVCVAKRDVRGTMEVTTGTATCSNADEFNEAVGKAIAYRRMINAYVPQELID